MARFLLAATWGALCVMIVAAPILSSHSYTKASAFFYVSFSFFCHQIQERSFSLCGHALAVCHRCSGIYLGFFLGSFVDAGFLLRFLRSRRISVLAATIPMLFDIVFSQTGFWPGAGMIRFLTGLLFGILISPLLVRGLTELLSESPRRVIAVCNSHQRKGYS